ncbi:hypothetical protein [Methylobacterium sp. E-045]|uniref:hypothetical protein n=1 Tax=Methylobacterium sp. E-045 TaxID=2836575 RepID=UPI001FB9EF92|nr:hypothetical protein [Methylobacterium sp. E-045]MCJ2128856.1 hypothetical protein [Methylobacterium sp. E-045]
MNANAFFNILHEAAAAPSVGGKGAARGEHKPGAWQILPLEGRFEIVYEDSRGLWSTRVLDARELRLGPGRTLLGGIDRARGGYRGFRVDRIRRLTEEAGPRMKAGILDWLLTRASAQKRERAERMRSLACRDRSRKHAA